MRYSWVLQFIFCRRPYLLHQFCLCYPNSSLRQIKRVTSSLRCTGFTAYGVYLRISQTVFLNVYPQTSVRQKYQSVLLTRWSIIPFAINSSPGTDSSCRTAVVNTNTVFTELWQCCVKNVHQNLTLLEHLVFKVTTILDANHLLSRSRISCHVARLCTLGAWRFLLEFSVSVWQNLIRQEYELRSLNRPANGRLFWPRSVSSSGYDVFRMRPVYGVNCISCRMRSRRVFVKCRVVADEREFVLVWRRSESCGLVGWRCHVSDR